MGKEEDFTEPFVVTAGCVGAFGLIAALIFVASVVHGFVLQRLWGWFVVTQLGAPPLSIAGAVGIGLIFSAMKGIGTESDDKTPMAERVVRSLVIAPALFLLIGWCAFQFMPN